MEDIKVGDRVQMVGRGSLVRIGSMGTVVEVNGSVIGVEWDSFSSGHDCDGRCAPGHGWRVGRSTLALIESTPLEAPPSDSELLDFLGLEVSTIES